MSTLTIRPAEATDVSAVFGMIAELAEFEKLSHLMSGTEAMLHEALFGPQPACECLVGIDDEDGQAIAFALYYHNYSTFLGRRGLYLEDIYVKPSHRLRGAGRGLLTELAKLAKARGCGRFEWSVLDWNEPAIEFYQGLGAEILPDWRIARVTGVELDHLAR